MVFYEYGIELYVVCGLGGGVGRSPRRDGVVHPARRRLSDTVRVACSNRTFLWTMCLTRTWLGPGYASPGYAQTRLRNPDLREFLRNPDLARSGLRSSVLCVTRTFSGSRSRHLPPLLRRPFVVGRASCALVASAAGGGDEQ